MTTVRYMGNVTICLALFDGQIAAYAQFIGLNDPLGQ